MDQLPEPIASEANSPDEEWIREYAPQGIRYATAMLRNEDDAEEAVQDAFVKILRSEKTTERRNARFFATIRNLCIDLLRKRSRKKSLSLEHVTEPASSDLIASESTERMAEIRRELDNLPPKWKQAITLKINQNKTYAEIAEVMSATHAQVRSWIFRARQQLRKRLLASDTRSAIEVEMTSKEQNPLELSTCQTTASSPEDCNE